MYAMHAVNLYIYTQQHSVKCLQRFWKVFFILLFYLQFTWFILNVFIVVIAELTITLDERDEQHESSLITSSEALGRIADGVMLPHLEQTNSISALFACENWNGLKNLEHLYVTDDLHSVLEELFTSLLAADDPQVTVHIKNIVWELSDYRRCSLYFNPLTTREFLQVIIFRLHLAYYLGILHIAFGKN